MSQLRRIEKEYNLIPCHYHPVKVSDPSAIIILVRDKHVQIVFGKDYPFRKPTVHIDNVSYTQFLQLPVHLQNIHYKLKKECCLICDSYACADKWLVTIRVTDIIREIEDKIDYINLLEKLYLLSSTGLCYRVIYDYLL